MPTLQEYWRGRQPITSVGRCSKGG